MKAARTERLGPPPLLNSLSPLRSSTTGHAGPALKGFRELPCAPRPFPAPASASVSGLSLHVAQSPRPPGPVLGRWACRGACALGTKGPKAVADQIAGGRRKAPGLGAVSVSPQTSLGRTALPKEPIRPARACMTQHDLAQAPTQAQRKPCLGGARSWARWGPRLLIRPFLFSPSFPVFTSKTRPQPGPAGPTQRGGSPGARTHRADGRALTLTQLRRPWRALHQPAAVRTAGNGSEGWQATAWAGTRLSRSGGGASGGDKPAGLPLVSSQRH